jgi:hypothetical protein
MTFINSTFLLVLLAFGCSFPLVVHLYPLLTLISDNVSPSQLGIHLRYHQCEGGGSDGSLRGGYLRFVLFMLSRPLLKSHSFILSPLSGYRMADTRLR